MIIEKMDSFEKLNKPGVWFVYSDLTQYVYSFAVELGLPVVVYSSLSKREIQNEVVHLIKSKCIESAASEMEKDWLEQEMTEYDTHGFFFYPHELNDYVPNGSFWTNYVHFDEYKILSYTNSFSHLYLIDNLSELCPNKNLSLALFYIEREAIEYKKTIIVFVSPNDSYANERYIKNHLL